MLREYLVPNQKVDIVDEADGEETVYSSWVEEVAGGFLGVATPMEGLRAVEFPVGKEVTVRFQKFDALYWFRTRIIGHRARPPVTLLEPPDRLVREQQRRFVRVEVSLPVAFKAVYHYGRDHEVSILAGEGKTRDLSGGGCCLTTLTDLPHGSEVFLALRVSPKEVIHAAGRVRRKEPGPRKRWIYGIEFVNLPTRVQDRIVALVFEEQRKLRKKGLL